MAHTAKSLGDGVLTGSLVAYYTAPASTVTVVKAMTVCNTTGGVVALTVSLVPRAAGSARIIVQTRNIAAGETYTVPEIHNQTLEAGGTISALGLAMTVYISGIEIV